MVLTGFLPSENQVLIGMAESLEAQAIAVRNAVSRRTSHRDRQLLLAAQETLEDLAELRKRILSDAAHKEPQDVSDDVCADIIRILDLPTDE